MFYAKKIFVSSFIILSLIAEKALAFDGDATWFHPGLGSCGLQNNDSDFVVALSTEENSGGRRCGQRITVHYQGNTVDATVVDTCPSCSRYSIDLSPAAFQKLATLGVGRIQVTWNYA